MTLYALKQLLPNLGRWIHAQWWRVRHGYDYRDCWNLDYSMAKWLATRLRHLAEHGVTYPGVPPYDYSEVSEAGAELWKEHLLSNAAKLERYATQWDEPFNFELESTINQDGHDAIKWVAEWWRCLWD